MALNFGLLGDAGAPAMGYLQGQQDVARNQLAQQQIETGRMTQDKMRMEMDAFKRRQAGLDQFMNKAKELGVNGDPEELTKAFWEHAISTGDPEQIQAATIAVQTARERKAYMAGQPGAGGAVATPVPMTNNLGTALPPAGVPPMPFNAGAAPAAAPPQGNALGGNRLSQIENRLLELRRFPTAGEKERTELIKERDRLMTPHVLAPGSSLATLGGGVGVASAEKPVQPKLHVVGKNLVDETGKIVFNAQPEPGAGVGGGFPAGKAPSGYRYTPNGDLEPIPGGPAAEMLQPKEIQKREAVLPQARQAVKTVSNTMSVIGQTVDKLLANPDGINGITGLIGGITPALTDKARAAKADLEQLKNLAFIQGITELRAASKTGAAVGNVSNREGDRFENLKASLDRSQSKDDLIAALKKLKQQADLTSQFMTEAFDETYSYKSVAPKPAGGGALSPAEEAELAQLRKRFGK
jgi:hypothetical protein